ncbi:Transcriptional regulatory protein EmbR [compost metagenome]
MLVNRNTYVSKWTICEYLWPDYPRAKAEQNLHTTVYRLKKTMLEHGINYQIEFHKGSYYLKGSCPCDYIELTQLVSKYTEMMDIPVTVMEQFIQLYRGQLFEGKDYSWCEGERERLQRLFSTFSKRLAISYSEAGESQHSLVILHSLITKLPYEEDGHELLLKTFLRLEDRMSFIVHYKKLKEMLQNDLGLEPRLEVRQLYERISQEQF